LLVILSVLVIVSGHKLENPLPNEADLINQVWNEFKSELTEFHTDFPNLRLAHVKQHGCVRATLTVNPAIKPNLAVGPIFSNKGKSFPVLARYSSGGGASFVRELGSTKRKDYNGADDNGLDNRAVAIKILGISGSSSLANTPGFNGQTSDWHFTTSTCAFTKNIIDGQAFFQIVNRGGLPLFLLKHPKLAIKLIETARSGKVPSLTTTSYSSSAPFAWGPDNAVKLTLRPFSTNFKASFPRSASKNKFRYMLNQALASSRNQGYDILAQEFTNEVATSIETGYNDWSSSYTKIGTLIIDSTSVNEKSEDFCRAITFNPWNTAPEYQPIGGVQRLRKTIYTEIQRLRRSYQSTMGKNVVNANGQNQEVTLDQVKAAYPLTNEKSTEMGLDSLVDEEAVEYDNADLTESTFDDAVINDEAQFDETVNIDVRVN